jgi:DNA helicase MCM8
MNAGKMPKTIDCEI